MVDYTTAPEDERCFFILRCDSGYLKELVYNRIKNISDELIGTYLQHVIGGGGEGKTYPSGIYSSGIMEIDRIIHDVNNDKTNMILGFECEPGQSKKRIVTEFEKKFPTFQPIIYLERFAFLPNEIQFKLDMILIFCGMNYNNNNINRGLLILHDSLMDSYNRSLVCPMDEE